MSRAGGGQKLSLRGPHPEWHGVVVVSVVFFVEGTIVRTHVGEHACVCFLGELKPCCKQKGYCSNNHRHLRSELTTNTLDAVLTRPAPALRVLVPANPRAGCPHPAVPWRGPRLRWPEVARSPTPTAQSPALPAQRPRQSPVFPLLMLVSGFPLTHFLLPSTF